jgi:dTDP-4-amino-4,6-dideoxygalactose transaminase
MVRLIDGFAAKRDAITQKLLEKKISTRRAIMAIHRERPYRAERWKHGLPQPNLAANTGLILPLFHQMTESDQDYIIDALHAVTGWEPYFIPRRAVSGATRSLAESRP